MSMCVFMSCVMHLLACWQMHSGGGLENVQQGRLGMVSMKNSHMVVIKVLREGSCLLCGFRR